jgi:hypothetical protein
MQNRSSKKKPPQKDTQQLARSVLDAVVPDVDAEPDTKCEATPEKNQAAVELGRLGGKKGGPARAAKLTPEQRKEIAKRAAAKRWGKDAG